MLTGLRLADGINQIPSRNGIVKEPDMTSARGHIRLKVEAGHVHRILCGQTLLLPGSGAGTALLSTLGLTNQTFLAPQPSNTLAVQDNVFPAFGAQQIPSGLAPAQVGCVEATDLRSARSCASSKLIVDFFLRSAQRFWPRTWQAKRSDAPNFSIAIRTHGGVVRGLEFSLSHLGEDVVGEHLIG